MGIYCTTKVQYISAQIHMYIYFGVSMTMSSMLQQNWWYHSLHKAHCTSAPLAICAMLSLFQGSRQMQNTGTSFVCIKYALPNRRVAPGVWKGKRQLLSTQRKKLDLILDWSYFSVWGSSPEHKDVAYAIANSPQSLLSPDLSLNIDMLHCERSLFCLHNCCYLPV
jgi:hypothetical protein